MEHFTKDEVTKGFRIETDGDYSRTTFFDKNMKVEAEYYYYKGMCDYKKSWGFMPNSLGEYRKKKASKTGKCFFSLDKGWFGKYCGANKYDLEG